MFWKVNECFQFLLNSKRLKYIIPIGLFCVIFGMTFIAFTLIPRSTSDQNYCKLKYCRNSTIILAGQQRGFQRSTFVSAEFAPRGKSLEIFIAVWRL